MKRIIFGQVQGIILKKKRDQDGITGYKKWYWGFEYIVSVWCRKLIKSMNKEFKEF